LNDGMSGDLCSTKEIDPNFVPPHHRWSGGASFARLSASPRCWLLMTVAGLEPVPRSPRSATIAEQTNPSVSEGKSQQVTALPLSELRCCKGWLDHICAARGSAVV